MQQDRKTRKNAQINGNKNDRKQKKARAAEWQPSPL
jgi:hypothetical protein